MPAQSGLPLVTGAAGFAGGHLVEHLLENEPRVAAWGHGPVASPLEPSDRILWATVDITDPTAVEAALGETRPSAVFHCAGIADVHSTAYPLGALSFVVVALLSRWLLREIITPVRWMGVGLIMAGCALIAL